MFTLWIKTIFVPFNNNLSCWFSYTTDWSLVDTRAYQPYTLVGTPVWRPVLDPLAVYASATIHTYTENTNCQENCVSSSWRTKVCKFLKGGWIYSCCMYAVKTIAVAKEAMADKLILTIAGEIWLTNFLFKNLDSDLSFCSNIDSKSLN